MLAIALVFSRVAAGRCYHICQISLQLLASHTHFVRVFCLSWRRKRWKNLHRTYARTISDQKYTSVFLASAIYQPLCFLSHCLHSEDFFLHLCNENASNWFAHHCLLIIIWKILFVHIYVFGYDFDYCEMSRNKITCMHNFRWPMSSTIFLSIEGQQSFLATHRAIFAVSIVFHIISLIFLLKYTPKQQQSWRNYTLIIQVREKLFNPSNFRCFTGMVDRHWHLRRCSTTTSNTISRSRSVLFRNTLPIGHPCTSSGRSYKSSFLPQLIFSVHSIGAGCKSRSCYNSLRSASPSDHHF